MLRLLPIKTMDGEEAASEITLDNLITQFKITATILTTLLPIQIRPTLQL